MSYNRQEWQPFPRPTVSNNGSEVQHASSYYVQEYRDLDYTLIVIVKNIWGFDRKPKLTQELLDPNTHHASINNTMILSFIGWQWDKLKFLRIPDQRIITKVKYKMKSWLLIFTISSLVGVGVTDQQVGALTVLDTKTSGTLQIEGDAFCILPMTLSRILHEVRHHTYYKEYIWLTMSEID